MLLRCNQVKRGGIPMWTRNKKEKPTKNPFINLVKHLGRVFGLTGIRIFAFLLKLINGVMNVALIVWIGFIALMIFCDLTGINPVNPKYMYLILLALTLGAILICNLIDYISTYLLDAVDRFGYELMPKTNTTTEQPTVHIIIEKQESMAHPEDVIIDGEYTEKEEKI